MDNRLECPRPLQQTDAAALIGLLSILEGEIWGGGLDEHLVEHLRGRLTADGVLTDAAGQYGVRQALNDLNHRVRYVLGEYADPPSSVPLPL